MTNYIELVFPETQSLIEQLVHFADNDSFCLNHEINAYGLVMSMIVISVEHNEPLNWESTFDAAAKIVSKATEIEPESDAWVPTLYDVVASMPEDDDYYND